MSKEYSIAIAMVLGSILKMSGIEIENSALEATIWGLGAIVLGILRWRRGDINALGVRKA